MTLKEFFKPTKKKIVIFIIFSILLVVINWILEGSLSYYARLASDIILWPLHQAQQMAGDYCRSLPGNENALFPTCNRAIVMSIAIGGLIVTALYWYVLTCIVNWLLLVLKKTNKPLV